MYNWFLNFVVGLEYFSHIGVYWSMYTCLIDFDCCLLLFILIILHSSYWFLIVSVLPKTKPLNVCCLECYQRRSTGRWGYPILLLFQMFNDMLTRQWGVNFSCTSTSTTTVKPYCYGLFLFIFYFLLYHLILFLFAMSCFCLIIGCFCICSFWVIIHYLDVLNHSPSRCFTIFVSPQIHPCNRLHDFALLYMDHSHGFCKKSSTKVSCFCSAWIIIINFRLSFVFFKMLLMVKNSITVKWFCSKWFMESDTPVSPFFIDYL